MSRVRANKITNKDASGAPLFTHGANITGVATATKFVGNVEGTLPATIGTGVTVTAAGILSATSYYGDGSNLTGAGPSLANGADNRVVTASSATALNGESNLTFDGSLLDVTTGASGGSNASGCSLSLENSSHTKLQFLSPNNRDNEIRFGDPEDNGAGWMLYAHSSNFMSFGTLGGERVRFGSAGQIGLGGANFGTSGQVLKSGGASAAPTWGDAPSGKVLRVYQSSTSAALQSNTTSWATTGLSVTLTPENVANAFVIQFNLGVMRKTPSTTASLYCTLERSTAGLHTWGQGYQLYFSAPSGSGNNEDRGETPSYWSYIDTNSTAGARTYEVRWRCENTSGSGYYLYNLRQMLIWELDGGINT
tara:strand:- start:388 stop:1482 length:1095 start_codon:yes stop_codon:yes gene_type:complete